MKKRIISVLLIAVTFGTLVSCSNSNSSKKSDSVIASSKEEDVKDTDSEEKSKEISNNESNIFSKPKLKKDTYIKKLNEIQDGLSDLSQYYAGSNADMKYAASEEFKRGIAESLAYTSSLAESTKERC